MLHGEHIVDTRKIFRRELVLVSRENHTEELRVRQSHAEVEDQVVVSYFEDLYHATKETVHVFYSWNK